MRARPGPGPAGAPDQGGPGRGGRDERGQVGGVEAVVFGVLVFVLGTLVVANAWGVIDAKLAASSAASEAARAFVQAPAGGDAVAQAQAAADQAIVDSGRSISRMSLLMEGSLTRCARVTAIVHYRVPVVSVPLLGGFGAGFVTTAEHAELVDPYRNGLPGQATCPA